MQFSIVTPNYNYGRFLKKALESVFAQTEADGAPEIEHIVIDGGSTDDSVQILERWASFVRNTAAAKESRYSFQFVSEPDKGQTDAINKGLRRARGDIVAWLNADEWYEPGALAKVASAFARKPKVDVVYGEIRFVKPDGSLIRIKRNHWFSGAVLLWYGCYVPSAGTFWRRRILEAGDYPDPSYKVTMDHEYWVRLWKHGWRFSFLPSCLASFTRHESNVSDVFIARLRKEKHLTQDQYAPRWARTGRGYAHYARILLFVTHQIHRVFVLARIILLPRT